MYIGMYVYIYIYLCRCVYLYTFQPNAYQKFRQCWKFGLTGACKKWLCDCLSINLGGFLQLDTTGPWLMNQAELAPISAKIVFMEVDASYILTAKKKTFHKAALGPLGGT